MRTAAVVIAFLAAMPLVAGMFAGDAAPPAEGSPFDATDPRMPDLSALSDLSSAPHGPRPHPARLSDEGCRC